MLERGYSGFEIVKENESIALGCGRGKSVMNGNEGERTKFVVLYENAEVS